MKQAVRCGDSERGFGAVGGVSHGLTEDSFCSTIECSLMEEKLLGRKGLISKCCLGER